jgi:hypothetical protein
MPEPCPSDYPQWLTPKQVSERLGTSTEVLTAWRNGGHGPPWLQIGPEARYDETDLVCWMERTSGHPLGRTR